MGKISADSWSMSRSCRWERRARNIGLCLRVTPLDPAVSRTWEVLGELTVRLPHTRQYIWRSSWCWDWVVIVTGAGSTNLTLRPANPVFRTGLIRSIWFKDRLIQSSEPVYQDRFSKPVWSGQSDFRAGLSSLRSRFFKTGLISRPVNPVLRPVDPVYRTSWSCCSRPADPFRCQQ